VARRLLLIASNSATCCVGEFRSTGDTAVRARPACALAACVVVRLPRVEATVAHGIDDGGDLLLALLALGCGVDALREVMRRLASGDWLFHG
jgi:hypothetical protein